MEMRIARLGLLALIGPGIVAGCTGTGVSQVAPFPHPGPRLKPLMEKRLNPAFTALSYWLFHNPGATDEDRFKELSKFSEELSKGAAEIPKHRPLLHADNPGDYGELAIMLRHYAVGLHDSAEEKNMPESILWFSHIKNTCTSCHRIYRFGEDAPMRGTVNDLTRSRFWK